MLGFIIKSAVGIATNYFSHKKDLVMAERKAEIKLAESKAELELTAQKQSIKLAGADAASERAKKHTYVDELLILGPVSIIAYTVFDPVAANEVISALSNYPIWLQVIIIGIYIGVFGLRSVFTNISKLVRNKK